MGCVVSDVDHSGQLPTVLSLCNGVVPHTAAKAWIVLNDQLKKAMRE
jgi:hypothetical protein